ncbi:hypothetical protein niasHS_003449 [Heterodera schachtii]|uniref:Uncharacterized protein n=2 Tax=Heterodera TaxID=34509 RepID=A0ABD2L4M3_9BILA
MAQHGMKKKTTLPAGAKQKSMKRAQKGAPTRGPKKGFKSIVPPKKASAVKQAKVNTEVSRMINEKNEEMVRERADRDVGKTTKQTKNN